MIFSGRKITIFKLMRPEKIAKSFRGYSFSIIKYYSFPEKAKSCGGYAIYSMNYLPFAARRNPPSNRGATRGRAKSMDILLRSNAIHGRRLRKRVCT